jgi:hypothetical protein
VSTRFLLSLNLPQQSPNNRPSWIVSRASFQAFRLGIGKYGVKSLVADESFRLTEEAFGLSSAYSGFGEQFAVVIVKFR